MQLFGMAGGFVVLTQIGAFPFAGAAAITAVSVVYYYVYARDRVEREGAARTGVRREVGERAIERTRELFDAEETYDALVAVTDETSESGQRDMLRIGSDLSRLRSTHVSMVRFRSEPHHVFGERAPKVNRTDSPEWLSLEGSPPEWLATTTGATSASDGGGGAAGAGPPDTDASIDEALRTTAAAAVDYSEVTAEDVEEAIVEFASYEGYDLLLLERRREEFHQRLLGGGRWSGS